MKPKVEFAAIDPLALIFPPEVYARIIVEWKHPHVPRVEELQRVVRTLAREDLGAALARAQSMKAYAAAVEEALSTIA